MDASSERPSQADPCEMVKHEITDTGKYFRLPILDFGSETIVRIVVLPQLLVLGSIFYLVI